MLDLFSTSPAKEHMKKAEEELNNGKPQDALRNLTAGFRTDSGYKPLYELAANILERMGGADESALFKRAAANMKSPETFFDLGYHFVDVEHWDLATPFLERTLELDPGHAKAALELSLAYTARFQPAKAVELLKRVKSDEFWYVFQLYFNEVLTGKADDAEAFAKDAIAEFSNADEKIRSMVMPPLHKLEAMTKRLKRIGKPELHIKDWYFIQYGEAVLDHFEEATVAGGRYVTLWGSNESMQENFERLRLYFQAVDYIPAQLYYITDRDSEIVGLTLSKVLGIKAFPYEQGTDTSSSLIVAADNSSFNGYTELHTIKPGQVVYSYNQNWLNKAMIAPDVTSVLTQHFFFPWSGHGLRFDHETGKSENIPADEREPSLIAGDIAATKVEVNEGFNKILDFYKPLASYLVGEDRAKERVLYTVDSPVPGSYFA
jgi:tetratricopeptide (TPR) repeat protein